MHNGFAVNPTLKFAHDCGMQFDFVSREDYRKKSEFDFIEKLNAKWNKREELPIYLKTENSFSFSFWRIPNQYALLCLLFVEMTAYCDKAFKKLSLICMISILCITLFIIFSVLFFFSFSDSVLFLSQSVFTSPLLFCAVSFLLFYLDSSTRFAT